jgi:hypothetical protein
VQSSVAPENDDFGPLQVVSLRTGFSFKLPFWCLPRLHVAELAAVWNHFGPLFQVLRHT